ncbi:MAG TPA: hypothetical protein VG053_00780 [Solirubrobacteraceae bacterium]|jgi:hypothetical protein|nr:hypothetical protein [Solirubrobacteraceae bacterium]
MDNKDYTEQEKKAYANGIRKGEKLGLQLAIEAIVKGKEDERSI